MTVHIPLRDEDNYPARALQDRLAEWVSKFVATHDEAKLTSGISDFGPCATALRVLCGLQVTADYEAASGAHNPVLEQNREAYRRLADFAAGLDRYVPAASAWPTPYRFIFFALKMVQAVGKADAVAAALDLPRLPAPTQAELPAFLAVAAEIGSSTGLALLRKTTEAFLQANPVTIGVHNYGMCQLAFRAGWLWAALFFAAQSCGVGQQIDEAILGARADDRFLAVDWPSTLPPYSGPQLLAAELPNGAILTEIADNGTIVVLLGRYIVIKAEEWGGDMNRLAQLVQNPAPGTVFETVGAARERARAG